MAKIRPFSAIRPGDGYAKKVISLPYDVMNREEASQMAENNPDSFLHICRAEIDLPQEKNPYAKAVYEKGRDNIDAFLDRGVFIKEEKPRYYIYRQIMNGNVQTGLVGCAAIDDYIDGTIKKHELTRVEKEQDRINHFDICNAHTEPVFLTFKNTGEIKNIINDYGDKHKPTYDLTTEDGVKHVLWVLKDSELINEITEDFTKVNALYIADGHHRSASACKVGIKRREENPKYTGEEEFNYFMTVIFPDEDLRVFDYNRVVKDLNGLTKEELLNKISQRGFEVSEVGMDPYKPKKKHEFGMLIGETWYKIQANSSIIPDSIVESLDVAILQNSLLGPILGILDPRTDKRIDFVGGIRGMEGLEARVKKDMKIAFAVFPVSIDDLILVSDNDMIMPPKSTWFEPKLGSGLFLHKL